jgi:hypothetical protein
MSDKILNIDKWSTPVTGKTRTVGRARLRRLSYAGPAFFSMEGTNGYDYFFVKRRIPVMQLQRREGDEWRQWMVDDPLHWHGMHELVDDLPAGRVVCAGLGLGLMVHHLCARRDIEKVDVIEIDPDVIELIAPTLPKDARVTLIEDDFYRKLVQREITPQQYDAILWDLAVGPATLARPELQRATILKSIYAPDMKLYPFGVRRHVGAKGGVLKWTTTSSICGDAC